MTTTSLAQKVAIWRQKSREGNLTNEDMREALETLREGRIGAAATSAKAKKAKERPTVDTAKLLTELVNM